MSDKAIHLLSSSEQLTLGKILLELDGYTYSQQIGMLSNKSLEGLNYPVLDSMNEILEFGNARDLLNAKFAAILEKSDKTKYDEVYPMHIKLLKELWQDEISKERKSEIISTLGNPKYVQDVHPYGKIPNVSTFKIESLADYQPILKLFAGIRKREGAPVFSKEPNKNTHYNRYLKHQFLLLHKYRNVPRKFWKLADKLLHSSIAFRLVLLFKIFPHWYKSMPYKSVISLLKNYNKLDVKNFRYKRLMIPKANGKLRSLGVPGATWRMYQPLRD